MFRYLDIEDRIIESSKEEILSALSAAGIEGCEVALTSYKWIWLVKKGDKSAFVCKTKSSEIVDIWIAETHISNLLPHMELSELHRPVVLVNDDLQRYYD